MMGPRLLLILLIVALHGVAEGRGIGERADVESAGTAEPARLENWHLRSGVIPGSVEKALASGVSRTASSLTAPSGETPDFQEVNWGGGCTTCRSRYDGLANPAWPGLLTAYDAWPPPSGEGSDGRAGLEEAEYDRLSLSSSYRRVLGASRFETGLLTSGWSTTGSSRLCTYPSEPRFNAGDGWGWGKHPAVWVHNGVLKPSSLARGSRRLRARAAALNAARGTWGGHTTTAIRVENVVSGARETWIAINGPRGMPKTWSGLLKRGEVFVQGLGHAEETIARALGSEWRILYGGVSRNVCKGVCAPALGGQGVNLAGRIFKGARSDKTLYRSFRRP